MLRGEATQGHRSHYCTARCKISLLGSLSRRLSEVCCLFIYFFCVSSASSTNLLNNLYANQKVIKIRLEEVDESLIFIENMRESSRENLSIDEAEIR